MNDIREALGNAGFFIYNGAYAVVDGQFGSTGKGLAASVLAEHFGREVQLVASNAGPNSGHTSYFKDEKIVLRQLPTFSVIAAKMHGINVQTVLNAGAIIDPQVLNDEYLKYRPELAVHPMAAVVSRENVKSEATLVNAVGSTGKGTGAALASKVMRELGAVAINNENIIAAPVMDLGSKVDNVVTLLEVSQGYSLSLNASGFYPYTTSRDCTVMQALSDAGIHPTIYRDCMMVLRTFPIRVAGNSGPHYADQVETTWEAIWQEPEVTTVTRKIRRVFTFSVLQYQQALLANRPSVLFVNFMNYLQGVEADHHQWLQQNIIAPYVELMGYAPEVVLLGYGARNEDVRVYKW